MLYYFCIIEADAYVLSMCEGRVLLEQAVGQSAAIRHPPLREIEGDWCGVAVCREVPCAVTSHDVNIEPDVPPAHAVEEGVLGWFVVVCHVLSFVSFVSFQFMPFLLLIFFGYTLNST